MAGENGINPRFRLLRYYSIASAVALIITTSVLAALYRHDQMEEFLQSAEEENTRLATSFSNTFWRQFQPFFLSTSAVPAEVLRRRGELRALDIAFDSLSAGLPILKIRVYDGQGRAVYSSVRGEVGESFAGNPGAMAAMGTGRAWTRMTFQPGMPALDGSVADRWVVQTIMPVAGESGRVIGGLELYSDTSPSMERLRANVWRLGGLVAAILAGLYLVLFLIVRRADRIIHLQHEQVERARETLQAKEERFRAIADYTFDWESWLDQDGRLQWVNPAVERLAGYSIDQCLAMEDYPLPMVHQDDRETIRRLREAALAGTFESGIEFRLICRNGLVKWVTASFQPIFADSGAIIGTRWSIHDITDRKKAERELAERSAELERSNTELQQFAYAASHDLQEPLRTVTSFLQLLQRRYDATLDDAAREYIRFATDGAVRMHRLITDLLVFSRVTTHGGTFQPVRMEAVLDTVLTNLGAAIQEAGAELTRDPLPELDCDEVQMVSLLQNLVGNAIKYRAPGTVPRVHVGAVRDGDFWRFSVSDNGIGIDPKYFERVFVIFQRLHTRTEYDGTGIGLAVAKKIVERHGGHIWVESVPGQGSTFHFTLPAKPGGKG
ncbi:sensor histidine kinase [Paramagnetospirillum caucaseum]|uniref:sensor histidine kinase n=1 Tax=Paramagnetospirillum caucaseum TaxID=1244869 RepID=UPI0013785003|nr:ATP-binding protein [Paramagnetospirillum caucaseum]